MKRYDRLQEKSPEIERLFKEVQQAIHSVVPGAEVILYGSRARGDGTPVSDWDFLVLVDHALDGNTVTRLRDRLYDVELERDTVISSIIRTREEWDSPRYSVLPFKRLVDKEGVSL
jgi:predicted nucleotidyltransferase